jgi:hypothetical protein
MTRALRRTALAAAVVGFAAFATNPAAAITFTVDTGNTFVTITNQTGTGPFGQVQAAIASTLPNSFNLNVGSSTTLDFITWTASPFATTANTFDVTASLAFSAPPGAGGTTGSGSGSALLILGAIIGGNLTWSSGVPNTITLADGNILTVDFQGGQAIILDHKITTHAYLSLSEGRGGGQDLATPLPAALPLFASGLGALGLVGWRRKKKASALAAR